MELHGKDYFEENYAFIKVWNTGNGHENEQINIVNECLEPRKGKLPIGLIKKLQQILLPFDACFLNLMNKDSSGGFVSTY